MPEAIRKTASKIRNNPDPIAGAVGWVVMILGILGVPEALDLTADEMTQLGGALVGFAASVRAVMVSRARRRSGETLTAGVLPADD